MVRAIRSTSSSRLACIRCASRSACWWIVTFIETFSLVSPSLIWKILQNQTSIFDNHSTTLYSRVSIISPDREHASLLLQAWWRNSAHGYQENGLSETELVEIITHLAFYSGWPK